ncbi:YtpI family protein [Paenibacillus sediminis]|uniref:ABC-type bacteriocin/lantibiotic exporter with double-glycine peptidase domain n=1 Tax=Paenibacillus sediminis TaxID=664909 RepID=A0ABS4H5L4_9BACL|nr:YtpI family protein [Paenibacillus sediminis]MBP1937818.1 ABC-type bacteriocin/lantibiotic exporter with double-glycine peptidase domain [Paenibacillus sediminis]
MILVIKYVLYALFIITSIGSAVNSYRSHRASDPIDRGLFGSRMNIFMGSMLIVLALIQMFVYSGSTLLVVIGAVFMVLGAFNIFAGLRNYNHFSKLKASNS